LVIRSERLRDDIVRRVVDTLRLEQGDATLQLDEGRLSKAGLSPDQIAQVRDEINQLSSADQQRIADELKARGRAQLDGRVFDDKEVLVRYKNAVSDTLNSVAGASAQLTAFSLMFSAWSASAMFGAVRRAINAVWQVEYQRPYFQQKLMDLVMVLGFGVLMLGSVGGTGALRTLREVSDEALGPLSSGTGLIWGVLPYLLPALASFAVFSLLYRFVPASRVRFRDIWLGALVAGLLFELLKNAFAFYVANFNAYDLLYGSLGGILLFLTGVYFASAILLVGAELAHAMPGLGAGAFAQIRDPSIPRPGLLEEVRGEVARFLRGLVLPPRSPEKGSDIPGHRRRTG
jgi:YihY family inner membrane protein